MRGFAVKFSGARCPRRTRCSPADRCSGYTADYTRCYLAADPAHPAARGELVRVRARELHADGLRCVGPSAERRGYPQEGS